MGYSPWGLKESDTTATKHFLSYRPTDHTTNMLNLQSIHYSTEEIMSLHMVLNNYYPKNH